ncbi:methionyl-tRNA formyltransferase [Nitrosomonas sp. Nm51]|uniref:methionyl-tRNA formyltransferase n=1 Tax=Nitrosomonas sp. Nm51 TaxID=133720 RepID=UPI0008C18916|nr:methionyl-tRNA formyltransferase [Nitrosomonas sp. Nm51]SER38863.1 methionyl-tRNA formyltransferase [Nitrosomonas sp. Nm51]
MKIIFAGTPVFAATALNALITADHEIVSVLTQPDRPAGRGMKMAASAVKQIADTHGLTVLQPPTLKDPSWHALISEVNADAMVVAAYGLILPESVLSIPRYGCFNIHASLLPRWRGAAPIQRAIQSGDKETGITIMQMNAGLDTGDMLLKKSIPILPDDTAQTLHDKLCTVGADSIVNALSLLQQKKLIPIRQDESQACYAAKIQKSEANINWQQPALEIERKIRAFNPAPGTYTTFQENQIKIWQAKAVPGQSDQPGKIMAIEKNGIIVSCGSGLLRLETVQKPGGKKLTAADFSAGLKIFAGNHFGPA